MKPTLDKLRRARLGLRFPADVESAFIQDYARSRQPLLRGSCFLSLWLYVLFVLMDGAIYRHPALAASFSLSTISSLLLLAMTYRPVMLRMIPIAVAVTITINAWVVIWGVVSIPDTVPFSIMAINLMYTFLLGGLLFRLATLVALGNTAIYLVFACLWHEPQRTIGDHLFTLLTFGSIGAVAGYLLERAERTAWRNARQLRELAFMDELTQLGNRRYFYAECGLRLEESRRENHDISLLIIDIDNFKLFNDTYGHAAGDDCIREVAQTIATTLRGPRDLCARIGGEEFVVMLYDCEREAARRAAVALMDRLATRNIEHRGSPFGRVTVSIGIAQTSVGGPDGSVSLFTAADRSLYRAKQAGRNGIDVA